MNINKICFGENGGTKSIQYRLTTEACVNNGVTVEAPDWIEVNERTEEKIFDFNVGSSSEVKNGELKFSINGNLCYEIPTCQNCPCDNCTCNDVSYTQTISEFRQNGETAPLELATYEIQGLCDSNVTATISGGSFTYETSLDCSDGSIKLTNYNVEPNYGKDKDYIVKTYYDNQECTSFSILQRGAYDCDCNDVKNMTTMRYETFPISGVNSGETIATYDTNACESAITAYMIGNSRTIDLICSNGTIKLPTDANIPQNDSGEIITYYLYMKYGSLECDAIEIDQDTIPCECKDIYGITLISEINPMGMRAGDIIGTISAASYCSQSKMIGYISDGETVQNLDFSDKYIFLTSDIKYNLGTEVTKTFTVDVYYSSNENLCISSSITQPYVLCDCDYMSFFVTGAKTTFPLSGTNGEYVVVATGNTLECGSLSAICQSNMLEGGDIVTQYNEETKDYTYLASILPVEDGMSRTSDIRLFFKGKDSSEYEECQTTITLNQTPDYSYCTVLTLSKEFVGNSLTVSQFGKYKMWAFEFTERNPLYHKYIFETSVPWIQLEFNDMYTDVLRLTVYQNTGPRRSGTVTIEQYLDPVIVVDPETKIETIKGGVKCFSQTYDIIQEAYEDVTCETSDAYVYINNRTIEFDRNVTEDFSYPIQTHANAVSAVTVDSDGNPCTYDWFRIVRVELSSYYGGDGDGTFGNQFDVYYNNDINESLSARTAYIRVYSVVNGEICYDDFVTYRLTQNGNECAECTVKRIKVYNPTVSSEGVLQRLIADYPFSNSGACGVISGYVTSDSDWLSVNENKFSSRSLYCSCTRNDTTSARTGTILVSIFDGNGNFKYGEDCYKITTVTQEGVKCTCTSYTLSDISTVGYENEFVMYSGQPLNERTHDVGFINGIIPSSAECLSLSASSQSVLIEDVSLSVENDGYEIHIIIKDEDIETINAITVDVNLMNGEEECSHKYISLRLKPPTA